MKKLFLIIFLLLSVTLFLLFDLKRNNQNKIEEIDKNANQVSVDKDLKIIFLDVGQGDASLIEFTNGEKMLIDCGQNASVLEALGRVLPYYENKIDYLLITHPDSDHYGGCIDVLKRFDVKNIFYNGMKKEYDDYWNLFWKLLQDEKSQYTEVNKENILNIASSSLHFLYPDKTLEKNSDSNNSSIVFELKNKEKEVLFMADAENELENYLVKTYGAQLDSDILKVGHHGSAGASGQEFLDIVTPEYSIISVGKNNKFGHPSLRVLKKLEREESKILRTDEVGDIECILGDFVICGGFGR